MTLLAIPNLSEGRRTDVVRGLVGALETARARVLDVHSDSVHNRSVITLTAEATRLPSALARLATAAAAAIDLRRHYGVHPRLGILDVCPIVPYGEPMHAAVALAHQAGRTINSATGIPVFFYGAAATRPETKELPALRKGGLAELIRRAGSDLPPDIGTHVIDAARGVACVGAREVLIAFNVWLRCRLPIARKIARSIRAAEGGLPGVRSLGLEIDDAPTSQVSMNLIDPTRTGIDQAFDAVAELARAQGVEITGSEIVGLVPERLMPDPNGEAARMLVAPGRSLEAALNG
jgi:glutamate formiminotransferase / 5-formyltetrahydrofolate cyclo-ligase